MIKSAAQDMYNIRRRAYSSMPRWENAEFSVRRAWMILAGELK